MKIRSSITTILASSFVALALSGCSSGPSKSAIAAIYQKKISKTMQSEESFASMLGVSTKPANVEVSVITMSCKVEKGSQIYNCDTVMKISVGSKSSTAEKYVRVARENGTWVELSD